MDNETLARVDERTANIKEMLETHITNCEKLYATKLELASMQLKPIVFLFAAIVTCAIGFVGQYAYATLVLK